MTNRSPTASSDAKASLRREMRQKLAALDPVTVMNTSRQVVCRLLAMPQYRQARRVMIYVSTGYEIDTHDLIRGALAEKDQVCVPQFDPDHQHYHPCAIEDLADDLVAGAFGILEPHPHIEQPVSPSALDLLVVPGLAFSRQGDRLGRGKGYFDRILHQVRGLTVALAHDFQVVPSIVIEPHDRAADFIVTETETISCGRHQP